MLTQFVPGKRGYTAKKLTYLCGAVRVKLYSDGHLVITQPTNSHEHANRVIKHWCQVEPLP